MARNYGQLRCNAPVGDGRCGQVITNAVCEPIDMGWWADEPWHHWAPGPTIEHQPCGHHWWRGQGWRPELERVPWAQ
jgi:hypothetical protein